MRDFGKIDERCEDVEMLGVREIRDLVVPMPIHLTSWMTGLMEPDWTRNEMR